MQRISSNLSYRIGSGSGSQLVARSKGSTALLLPIRSHLYHQIIPKHAQVASRMISSTSFARYTSSNVAAIQHDSPASYSKYNCPSSNAEEPETKEYAPVPFTSYKDINPYTLLAIQKIMKFETASKVQDQIISRMPITKDVMIKAKTGTGKTAAFLIPAIETLLNEYNNDPERRTKGRSVGCLIVSPTRELAKQITTEAEKLVKFHGWNVQSLVGGESSRFQVNNLHRRRSDIVIGTPGRLLDFLTNQPIFSELATGTKLLILDEADVLLQMGFQKELDEIMRMIPAERQTFLVSATIDKRVRQLAPTVFQRGFDLIDCVDKGETNTHQHVKQEYVQADLSQQLPILCDILHTHIEKNKAEKHGSKVVVFVPTVNGAGLYYQLIAGMMRKGFVDYSGNNSRFNYRDNRRGSSSRQPGGGRFGQTSRGNHQKEELVCVDVLHGKLSQERRSRVSDRFRNFEATVGNTSILVTTDVSARGVDYPNVSMVVQVGIPSEPEAYIHRLGRTGRAGRSGEGIILLNKVEMAFLKHLKDVPITPSEKYTPEYIETIGNFADGDVKHLSPRWEKVTERIDIEEVQNAYLSLLGFYQGNAETLSNPPPQDLLNTSSELLKVFNAPEPPLPSQLRLSLGLDKKPRRSRPQSGGNRFGDNNRRRGGDRGFGRDNYSRGSGGNRNRYGFDDGYDQSNNNNRFGSRDRFDSDGGRFGSRDRSDNDSGYGSHKRRSAPWMGRGKQSKS